MAPQRRHGAAVGGYYIVFKGTAGATLGKRLLHLKVFRADGHGAGITAAATRNLWLLFGLVPCVGGLLQLAAVVVIAVTIATDGQRRGRRAASRQTRPPRGHGGDVLSRPREAPGLRW